MSAPSPAPAAGRPSAPLTWAVRLLYGEAAILALATGYLLYADATGDPDDLAAAVAVTGYTAMLAAALAGTGYGLGRRHRWVRGPAIALQLMLVLGGYYMTTGGLALLGLPTGLLGLVVAALLVTGSSTRALGIGVDRSG